VVEQFLEIGIFAFEAKNLVEPLGDRVRVFVEQGDDVGQ